MIFKYQPKGVCASSFLFEIEEGIVKNVSIEGGCNGNLKGIANLIKDLSVDEIIEKLEGINCGSRITSCPDQISIALKSYKAENKN